MKVLLVKDPNGKKALHIGPAGVINGIQLTASKFGIEVIQEIDVDLVYSVLGENPFDD